MLAGVEDDRAPGQGVVEELHVGVVHIRGVRTRDQLTRGHVSACLPRALVSTHAVLGRGIVMESLYILITLI